MKIGDYAGLTDTGRKRRRNEDAYVVAPPLFGVADGMGGAQAGELASGLAAAAMREANANGSGEQRISDLIQEANRRVHDRASTDASASGMGTTMTVALVERDGRVVFGHVGDSRAYVLRDNRLDQLTDDHSLVAELVRRGELSPAEAEVHPQRSVITRALGTDPDVDIDTFAVSPQPGDVFLICSDGLSSYVDGEPRRRRRQHHGDPVPRRGGRRRDRRPGAGRADTRARGASGGRGRHAPSRRRHCATAAGRAGTDRGRHDGRLGRRHPCSDRRA